MDIFFRARKKACVMMGASVMLLGLAPSFAPSFASTPAVAPTAADYARAERFLPGKMPLYVDNANIEHHWLEPEDEFWYRRTNAAGEREFVLVDAKTGRRRPAFDQKIVAGGLSEATKRKVDAGALPFGTFRYVNDRSAIRFELSGKSWTCQLTITQCAAEAPSVAYGEVMSPDGKWVAFVRDHNLWIRPVAGGAEFPLTRDGVEGHGYATMAGYGMIFMKAVRMGLPLPTQAAWSPDSRRLLSYRLDERKTKTLSLLQSVPEDGSMRPKLYTFHYPMPGDADLPMGEPFVFDVVERRQIKLAIPPFIALFAPPMQKRDAWWGPDSNNVYFVNTDRYRKVATLFKVDAATGSAQELLKETSTTNLHLTPEYFERSLLATLRNGDVIWYSTRDGWGHLYRYNAAGKLLNQITRGEWTVRSIARIDEKAGRLYFMGSGREKQRDPYERSLYSVRFDGSDMRLLTPEPADHELPHGLTILRHDAQSMDVERGRFSPSGRYFVDSYSRPNTPPVFVLRTAAGRLVKKLEEADVSKLVAGGYTPVEPFQAIAADGKTPIYGNVFRPSTFDPNKRYPVIDAVYPGPQQIRAGKNFGEAVFGTFDSFEAQSLAELGFIVVTIDGRGTLLRSKAFLDYSYGRLQRAGDLDDHIAGIRQLAERYPYMDLDRVGIDGLSGGGFAAARALLAYPDFYKVGVSAAGNHDQRGYISGWADANIGPAAEEAYLAASNLPLAGNLKGKLLLIHGDMDENVSPTLTLKLVDALVKANKDFDLLILPNEGHGASLSPYAVRRKWDYFVRNLLGVEPPAQYRIGAR